MIIICTVVISNIVYVRAARGLKVKGLFVEQMTISATEMHVASWVGLLIV